MDVAAAIAKQFFVFFFQKKVSCTRHLWISFYDSSGGRLVWPHVTSLYIAKKKLQLATTGKMCCR